MVPFRRMRVSVIVTLFGPERGRVWGQDTHDLKSRQLCPANLALARACGLLPLGLLHPSSRLRGQAFACLEWDLIVFELPHPKQSLLDQAAPSRSLATVFKFEADLKPVRGLEAFDIHFKHRAPLGRRHGLQRLGKRDIGEVQGGPADPSPVRSTNPLNTKTVLAYLATF